MAAAGADIARVHSAVVARPGHDSNRRTLLFGYRAVAAGGLGKHRSTGARAALSLDGTAHVVALWLELARVLRPQPVSQFHRTAVPSRGDNGVRRRYAQLRGGAVGRSRRRPTGPVGADEARHPAGDAGPVTAGSSGAGRISPRRVRPAEAWCWTGVSSIRCAVPAMRASAGSFCAPWARPSRSGSNPRAVRALHG